MSKRIIRYTSMLSESWATRYGTEHLCSGPFPLASCGSAELRSINRVLELRPQWCSARALDEFSDKVYEFADYHSKLADVARSRTREDLGNRFVPRRDHQAWYSECEKQFKLRRVDRLYLTPITWADDGIFDEFLPLGFTVSRINRVFTERLHELLEDDDQGIREALYDLQLDVTDAVSLLQSRDIQGSA